MSEQPPSTYVYSPPTHPLAIISLVAGIAGLTIMPTIGSIVGVITGHLARRDIRQQPSRYSGDGLALAGVITSWVGIGVGLLGLCVVIVFVALWIAGVAAFLNISPPTPSGF